MCLILKGQSNIFTKDMISKLTIFSLSMLISFVVKKRCMGVQKKISPAQVDPRSDKGKP